MYSNRFTRKKRTETNSLNFLLLLLRRYKFVLGAYLVHDDASEDAFYQVEEELIAPVDCCIGVT